MRPTPERRHPGVPGLPGSSRPPRCPELSPLPPPGHGSRPALWQLPALPAPLPPGHHPLALRRALGRMDSGLQIRQPAGIGSHLGRSRRYRIGVPFGPGRRGSCRGGPPPSAEAGGTGLQSGRASSPADRPSIPAAPSAHGPIPGPADCAPGGAPRAPSGAQCPGRLPGGTPAGSRGPDLARGRRYHHRGNRRRRRGRPAGRGRRNGFGDRSRPGLVSALGHPASQGRWGYCSQSRVPTTSGIDPRPWRAR